MTIRYIDAGTVPFFRSQSIYHGLGYAQKKNTPDTIVLVTPASKYISIGNFQDPIREINLAYSEENNLPLIRRQTGGGAVYIDENQLFTQWIFQSGSLPARVSQRFEFFLKPLIETHRFFGIDAYFHPVNDVHVKGRKIAGTGAATIGNAEVLTGNFLFDFDYEAMTNVLNLPGTRKMVSQSLRKYVTTISREISNYRPDDWKKIYLNQIEKHLGCSIMEGEFSDQEIKEIEKWDRKLTGQKWLFSVKRQPEKIKLVKIHAGFWIGIAPLNSHPESGFVEIGMLGDCIEYFQIEQGRMTNGIAKVLEGAEITYKGIAERLAERKNYVNDKLLMTVEELTTLILTIKKERDGLAGV